MSFLPRLVLGSSIALLAASSSLAAVFGDDDRIRPQSSQISAFAPIGVVRPLSGLGSWALPRYATGFLIDDCHVLTVQHLLGDDTSPVGKRVGFSAGHSTPNLTTTHGSVVAAGNLQHYSGYSRAQGSKRYEEARAHDWMLVRLDQCIGRVLGHVRLSLSLPGWQVESAGFPLNILDGGLKIDPACRIRYQTDLLWLNDCASAEGNSGSPIFNEIQEGGKTVLQVYGMQTAGWSTNSRTKKFSWYYANVATPVSKIIPQIAQFVPLDRKRELASR